KEDRLDLGEARHVARRGEPPGAVQGRDTVGADMPDIGLAGIEALDLDRVEIETEYRKTPFGDRPRQGQPDIAETDDSDPRRAVAKAGDQRVDIDGFAGSDSIARDARAGSVIHRRSDRRDPLAGPPGSHR